MKSTNQPKTSRLLAGFAVFIALIATLIVFKDEPRISLSDYEAQVHAPVIGNKSSEVIRFVERCNERSYGGPKWPIFKSMWDLFREPSDSFDPSEGYGDGGGRLSNS